MTRLYPLKFKPIYKEKIWGGQKIRSVLNKDFGSLSNCGESWEISGVEGDVSIVSTGDLEGDSLNELIRKYKGDLLGDVVYERFQDEFPLLIKFIDANQYLSVQVHPDDALASQRHQSFGKTEMWYILQADPGSTLITGFNRELDQKSYLEYFNSGKLMDILNQEEVMAGDVYFLPAGRVHTIGKGLLLAEIQQTSDVTYRIYDFDRKDASGNTRELHTTEALDALDYSFHEEYKTTYQTPDHSSETVVDCPYFTTAIQEVSGSEKITHQADSFTILIGVKGSATLQFEGEAFPFGSGETLLVPACITEFDVVSTDGCTFLKTWVPA